MKYDVVIIGGGPAGLMAAGRAGELGARVILLEKNINLGTKLLITGNGRCNITNKSLDKNSLIDKFGRNGKFLLSSFSRFGTSETIEFFEKIGVVLKVEENGKIFPKSDRSKDVLNALIAYNDKFNVCVRSNSKVKEVVRREKKIEKAILENGEEISGNNFVICTGGVSYPATGSTGDGYKWLKKLGHTIIEPLPSLTPIIIRESFIKELEGLSLKDVEINVYKNNKKIDSKLGDLMFTSDGLSGPATIDLSRKIGKELPEKINIKIDFVPKLNFIELDKKIQECFNAASHKILKNSLDNFLPRRIFSIIAKLSKVDSDKKVNLISREERKRIVHLIKEFDLEVQKLAGFDKAVITSGGVKLSEVDPKTMRSKIVENLYLAGEILDLDGPTGGYNLQVCWSTGFAAGEAVCKKHNARK